MKIGRTNLDGHQRWIVHDGDRWHAGPPGCRLADVLAGPDISGWPPLGDQDPLLLAPYDGGTIFGIGLNYRSTVAEMNWPVPSVPYLFPKLAGSVTGPQGVVVADPALSGQVDWEGELAVVIGRRTRNVDTAEALAAVYGYTAANDISARDLQAADGQWVRGKGLDTFCPLGPVIVPASGIDPANTRIRTWVNGNVVQDGNTSDMIFGVAELVAYLSSNLTLMPGDIILSGTPAGCGGFQNPQRFLAAGDTVEVEVDHIGRLTNVVEAG
ncbi:5-carboxymethyl-2-hydroxymuconate isomerase [Kribbella aluminosa]|uniref:5-carboxymethyl-2-hydroxymuconate isomerase n=1 Tax=Kribbella aluminosa TaxID=416017 RepID=A0ABS4UJ52_9ACTN|nr:fumarylacetoacetate hydrolase family protein [Kribbella aluminosa]MBP2351668.1 5-carboxymethyl-2-hydroxymuconate isomerase [Kribbella aluminosa]